MFSTVYFHGGVCYCAADVNTTVEIVTSPKLSARATAIAKAHFLHTTEPQTNLESAFRFSSG